MKLRGVIIASAALGLLAAAPTTASAEDGKKDQVKCAGVNACGGHGECGAGDGSHACAGKNACKGKGWVYSSAEECETKGGKKIE